MAADRDATAGPNVPLVRVAGSLLPGVGRIAAAKTASHAPPCRWPPALRPAAVRRGQVDGVGTGDGVTVARLFGHVDGPRLSPERRPFRGAYVVAAAQILAKSTFYAKNVVRTGHYRTT